MNPFDEAQMTFSSDKDWMPHHILANEHTQHNRRVKNKQKLSQRGFYSEDSDDGPCSRSTSFQENFHFSEDLQLEVDIFQYLNLTLSRNTGNATYLPQDHGEHRSPKWICVFYIVIYVFATDVLHLRQAVFFSVFASVV